MGAAVTEAGPTIFVGGKPLNELCLMSAFGERVLVKNPNGEIDAYFPVDDIRHVTQPKLGELQFQELPRPQDHWRLIGAPLSARPRIIFNREVTGNLSCANYKITGPSKAAIFDFKPNPNSIRTLRRVFASCQFGKDVRPHLPLRVVSDRPNLVRRQAKRTPR
jgi:hypothetical protein